MREKIVRYLEENKITAMELSRRSGVKKSTVYNLINGDADPMELDRDQIVFFLERFRDGDAKDERYREFLVDTFLQAVFVYDDRLVITLNYSGRNNKVTKSLADKAASGEGSGCSCLAPSGALNGADLNTAPIRIFWIQKVIGVVAPYDRKIQEQKKKARV